MTLFDAFYFMSYTATTIGFGELPWPFTTAQRLWVTFSIYLSVIGWAYAIGSLLTLLQDHAFRHAVALQRYPEVESVNHVHHPGNSSGIVDGAAAVLIGSKQAGERAGRKPRAPARRRSEPASRHNRRSMARPSSGDCRRWPSWADTGVCGAAACRSCRRACCRSCRSCSARRRASTGWRRWRSRFTTRE